MNILHWPTEVVFLAIDVDETIYPKSPDYTKHQRAAETQGLAAFWGVDSATAQGRLDARSRELTHRLKRKPSAAEVIRSFGEFTQDWLVRLRAERWRPEDYLSPYPGLPGKVSRMLGAYRVAFVSTSPKEVLERIFFAIGFHDAREKALIIGGGDAKPKPAPDAYEKVVREFGLPAHQGLSIGDRIDFDGYPAIQAGLGAVIIGGIEDFVTVVDRLLLVKDLISREVVHG